MDVGLTLTLAVVAPVLQEKVVPPLAVSVALAPLQMETVAGKMAAVGEGLTVTCLDVEAEHLLASVTVTEYVVVDGGLTVMLAVVSPVLHEKVVPPLAVRVALAPGQMETVAGEIDAVGNGVTFTVRDAVPEHPLPSVAVTE